MESVTDNYNYAQYKAKCINLHVASETEFQWSLDVIAHGVCGDLPYFRTSSEDTYCAQDKNMLQYL